MREQLLKYFAEKLAITGFIKGDLEDRYLLDSDVEAQLLGSEFEWRRKGASSYSVHED